LRDARAESVDGGFHHGAEEEIQANVGDEQERGADADKGEELFVHEAEE
jgi:hypothetical protein